MYSTTATQGTSLPAAVPARGALPLAQPVRRATFLTHEPSMTCSFDEFKQRCKELLDAVKAGLDTEGTENGRKMLSLSFLGMEGTELEKYQARLALQLVFRELGLL